MKYFLITIAVLTSISSLAARLKIFKRNAGVIKRADSIRVYTIGTYPVEKKVQDSNRIYVADYPVTNTILLTNHSISFLKIAVLQQDNYITDAQKRCPFTGEFAVVFTKGNKTLMLIISHHACSKILVYLPGAASATPYDLAENNSIKNVLPKEEVERL